MATGVAIAGVGLSAYQTYKSGKDAKKQAESNQAALNQTALDNEAIARENMAIAHREATAVEARGLAEVELTRKRIGRLLAYQRTQEAITGFKYEGTAVDVARESELEGEQDVAMIWANAVTEADLIRDRGRVASLQGERIAGQLRTQGDITAQQGKYAESAGLYGGAATLLSGLSSAYTASKINK